MDQYDYLTREQLIALVQALGATREDGRGPVPGHAEGLPEFDAQQRRQFDASPLPMRVCEHGTRSEERRVGKECRL